MRNETQRPSTPAEPDGQVPYDPPQGCLLRLFWMAIGNLALLALAVLIFQRQDFSLLDLTYWGVVVALGAARYADIARFAGLTINGEPATILHFRRYLLGLLLLATGIWISVHAPRLFL